MAVQTDDLLKYAVGNDMIDLSYIRQQYDMNKKEEILKKHPYRIWENKDGRWFTYLPERDGGRKQISSKDKVKLEDMVVEHAMVHYSEPLIEDIFNEWIERKFALEDISPSTKSRYKTDYRRYFSEFGKRRIKGITPADIEDFIRTSIHEYSLTVKGYSGLRLIVYGIFKLAYKKDVVSFRIQEVVQDIEFSKKTFRKPVKDNSKEVFTEKEERMIEEQVKNHPDITGYGLLLLFQTGLRVGELAGLKWVDVEKDVIHVRRTETKYYDDANNRIIEVSDNTKTDAGTRDVYLPNSAQWIVHQIRLMNPFGEYVFMSNGKRLTSAAFNSKIRRVCTKVGIPQRSPHKIRKTYGTKLYDSKNIPESFICSQMGHTDISCLQKYYYFNRMSEVEKNAVINSVNF